MTRLPSYVHGTSATPLIGQTIGQTTFSGSFEVYEAEWSAMVAALEILGIGYMQAQFGMTVAYANPLDPDITTDVLFGVMIRNVDESHSQGGEALTVRVDFTFQNMSRNGAFPQATIAEMATFAIAQIG